MKQTLRRYCVVEFKNAEGIGFYTTESESKIREMLSLKSSWKNGVVPQITSIHFEYEEVSK